MIQFPLYQIDKNKIKLDVDTRIYAKEALNNALYKYTGDYYVHQQIKEQDTAVIEVYFEKKDSAAVVTEEEVKNFCNELIDFQLRYDNNKTFGHIRDLIVEQAFKPVNK